MVPSLEINNYKCLQMHFYLKEEKMRSGFKISSRTSLLPQVVSVFKCKTKYVSSFDDDKVTHHASSLKTRH